MVDKDKCDFKTFKTGKLWFYNLCYNNDIQLRQSSQLHAIFIEEFILK